jgi:hypothetical protein
MHNVILHDHKPVWIVILTIQAQSHLPLIERMIHQQACVAANRLPV